MSKATVVVTVDPATALPPGAKPFVNILLTLTDSAGAAQTATVDGTEIPTWTVEFDDIATVAGAVGTVIAQAQDASGGAIGAPVTQTFTELGSTPTGGTFPAPTSLSVTVS